MKQILAFVILSIFLFSFGENSIFKNSISPANSSEQKTISLKVDGIERTFVLYLPGGYNNAGKMPLIFVLHGGGGSGGGMIRYVDFRPIADRDKVVLVYPSGIQKSWNDGRATKANRAGVNDVNFFSAMCDYLLKNYPIDSSRIYATGMSNGGFMTSRLGCELSERIAAIAVVSATMGENTIYTSCNPGRPVPAIYIHGTKDPLVPFNGGEIKIGAGGTIVSHQQVIDKWVGINNCNPTPIVTDLPNIADDGTSIQETKYINGTNGSEVVSYVITNGGHTWPQSYQYLPKIIIGKTSQNMNACETIWQFFKRFKR